MSLTRFPRGLSVGYQKNASGASVGWEVAAPVEANLGAPITADIDSIIDGATSTELPNNATKTYTTANIGTSPCDGANTTWVLDVPRNIVLTVTHSSSIVAMSAVISGYDAYGQAMSESLAVTATGTTKTTNGKKAFKRITSIAFTASADATANTAEIGHGDVLGLPLVMTRNTVIKEIEDNATATAGTVVVADTTSPATTSTGDVRGTYDPNSACDGSKVFRVIYIPTSYTSHGITQV